jgi:hypothetical protein
MSERARRGEHGKYGERAIKDDYSTGLERLPRLLFPGSPPPFAPALCVR